MSAVPDPSISASWMRRPSKRSGVVEERRAVHRDLRAEAAVPEVRPVAHLAVADADQVSQAVAGHVRQENRLVPSREDESADPFLHRERMRHGVARDQSRASPVKRASENAPFSLISRSGKPSPGQVDEAQIRSSPVEHSAATRRATNGCQSASSVRSKYPGIGPSKSTRSSWPSPDDPNNCCLPLAQRAPSRARGPRAPLVRTAAACNLLAGDGLPVRPGSGSAL